MFYTILSLIYLSPAIMAALARWLDSLAPLPTSKGFSLRPGVASEILAGVVRVLANPPSEELVVGKRVSVIERFGNLLRSVLPHLILIHLLHFSLSYVGVAAFGYRYVIDDIAASSFGILTVVGTWGDSFSVRLYQAIGTDPEKNWKRHMEIIRAQGLKRESLGVAFVFSHYSANPSVWDRILKNLIDDPSLTSVTDTTQWVVDFRAFRTHCEWKTGAPTSGKISPQRFHGSNPTFAAYTYLVAFPNANIGYKHFVAQRWVCALWIAADVEADTKAAQEKFMKDVLKRTLNDKLYNLVSSSTFWFPEFANTSGTFTYKASSIHGAVGSMVPLDKAKLAQWVEAMQGPTAAEFLAR